jgi:hypothetical protein
MTTYNWGTDSGLWSVDTNWTPTGVPSAATDQAYITAAGTYTITVDPRTFLLDSLVLSDPDAQLDVGGTLDFAGVDNTLALDAGTLLLDGGAVIQGATIQSDGGTLTSHSGVLDDVTYQGELDLAANYGLAVQDVTVESAAGTPPGTIVLAYNSILDVSGGLTVGAPGSPGSIQMQADYANLYFEDSETLDNAVVTISGLDDIVDSFLATLTLGANTTVTLSGTDDYLFDNIVNLGSLGVTGGTAYLADSSNNSTFDNEGSLSVDNGTLYVYNSTFTNEGSIDVGSGGLLENNSPSFSNAGVVTVESGGTFEVQSGITNTGTITVGSGATLELQSALTNTGTITVQSGGTLDAQYPLTLADLETLPIAIEPGATLEISGSLDLGGGVLDMAPSGAFGNVVLSGGTIADGTIFVDGGNFSLGGSDTFDGIIYQGDLDLADSVYLTVLDGLTVESAAGTPPGTIVFGYASSLNISGGLTVGAPGDAGSIQMENSYDSFDFSDSETLDNAAITISGYLDVLDATNYTLTLGADTTVDLSGSNDYLYDSITNLGSVGVTGGTAYFADNSTGSTFDNQGSVSVDNGMLNVYNSTFSNEGSVEVGNGGLLSIYTASFSNTGTITVGSGGALQLYSPLADAGTIVVGSGGTLDLQEDFVLSDLVGSGITIEPGATLEISGSLDLGGGVLDLAPSGAFGNVVLSGGTIADGTIFVDGGNFSLIGSDTFDGITYQGELDLADSVYLTVLDGLTVESAAGTLPGMIVFGDTSSLNISGGLTVGAPGDVGSIQMENSSDYIYFGDSETLDNAAVTISGDSDVLDATYYTLTLGSDTTVDLSGSQDYLYDSITNLGSVGVSGGTAYFADNYTASIFDNQGSVSVNNGTLNVYNSSVINEGRVDVGSNGLLAIYSTSYTNTGTIIVESGGTLDPQDYVTLSDIEGGSVTIEPGGTLEISGTLDLQGGTLDIAATGVFSNLVLTGGGTIENGTIVPDGGMISLSGGTLDNITYLGELDIPDFASLAFANGLTVESSTGAPPGTIVFGYGSSLTVSGGLTVGAPREAGSIRMENTNDYMYFGDSGTLDNATVTISGYSDVLDATDYTLTLGADTTVDLSGSFDELDGSITNLGSIGVTGGSAYFTDDSTASTFDNQGSLIVGNGALYVYNGTFSNEGQVSIGSGGYLDVQAGTFTSTTAFVIHSGGTLEIAPATAVAITYNDPALVILDNPATYTGTIAGLSVGDQLQLNGQDVTHASISGGVLTADLQGGGTLTFNADPALNGTTFGISQGSDGAYQDLLTAEIPCFLPGTHIRTTRGEVMVQDLAVGDTVITHSGRHRPLCWIGKGRSLAVRGRRSAATPLIVRKGALADNVPNRDLRITKGHSLFLDDVLIPVEFLVNHRSILWDDVTREVEVYHLELDEHDILIANGAAAESYRDDGNRWLFQNANSGWDQPAKPPCAPVLTGGPIVDAVWRRLLDRAGGPTRLKLTQDAQVALSVDGMLLAPTVLHDGMAVFCLPKRPSELRLVSRSAVPLELGVARDARELGVAFEWLAVRKGSRCRMIAADDSRLIDGFHTFEADEGIRWTNGDALLSGELFAGFRGEFEVAIHLRGATQYVDDGEWLLVA